MSNIPCLIEGGEFQDGRGSIKFFNDFSMSEIKRMYLIEHRKTNLVRAWQGHKIEQKWFLVLSGVFHFIFMKPDNWEMTSKELNYFEFILTVNDSKILYVPNGFINGFKSLEENSKVIVYSDLTISDALSDNLKYEKDYWNYF